MSGSENGATQTAGAQGLSRGGAFATAVAHVSQFYPLWFTYNQSRFATHNRLVGPEKVTPTRRSPTV